MPRATREWIGKSDNTQVPPRVRLRIFEKYNGVCQLSFRKIGAGEKWECHHIKGLIEGGENRESNLVPVLVEPHKQETRRQLSEKKKINQIRKRHLGIIRSKQKIKSLPFSTRTKPPRITKIPLLPRAMFESKRPEEKYNV